MSHSDFCNEGQEEQGNGHDLDVRQNPGRARGNGKTNPFVAAIRTLDAKGRWPIYRSLAETEHAIGQYRQIVRCWLPAKGITFIVGQRSMGKTQVLIDQGLTIAADHDHWHGFPLEPGYWVIYICGESADSATAYRRAWQEANGEEPQRFLFTDHIVDLKSRKNCEELVTSLRGYSPPGAPAVVYLDTWQRTISPAATTDEEVMQKAADNAEWIGQELSAAIAVAAHPPKGAKTKGENLNAFTISGAGLLENVSQALWFINPQNMKKPDKLHIALENKRIKGPGEGSRLWFYREVVDIEGLDTFGKARTGVVLEQEKVRTATTTSPKICTIPAELMERARHTLELKPTLSARAMAKELGVSREKAKHIRLVVSNGQDQPQERGDL